MFVSLDVEIRWIGYQEFKGHYLLLKGLNDMKLVYRAYTIWGLALAKHFGRASLLSLSN